MKIEKETLEPVLSEKIGKKMIVFTSALFPEETTLLALKTAEKLTQQGEKVFFVDSLLGLNSIVNQQINSLKENKIQEVLNQKIPLNQGVFFHQGIYFLTGKASVSLLNLSNEKIKEFQEDISIYSHNYSTTILDLNLNFQKLEGLLDGFCGEINFLCPVSSLGLEKTVSKIKKLSLICPQAQIKISMTHACLFTEGEQLFRILEKTIQKLNPSLSVELKEVLFKENPPFQKAGN